MDKLQFINEGVFAFVESFIFLLLFTLLNNNKKFIITNKFYSIIFGLFYTVFSYWASSYIPPGIHTVFHCIFLVTILGFITKVNIYTSIISVLLMAIFMILSEFIVIIIEMSLFHYDMSVIMNNPEIKFIHSIFCKLVQIILTAILFKFNVSVFTAKIFTRKNIISSFVLLQTFMMGIFIFSLNYVISYQLDIRLYNILLFIIFILYITLSFLDYKEREQMLKIQNKFELQEEHVKNMEVIMDIIRREKHDFSNHLNTIFAMCVLKKSDSLKKIEEYIRNLTNNLNSSYKFYHTGNDYIDGLLAVKSNFAFEHDINFDVDFEAPLSAVDVNDSDLTSIIGNVIDNAFEAILSMNNSDNKAVSLFTYIEDQYYHIAVSNNGPQILPEYIDKIFNNGFSTKKNNKKEHGYGLYITKKMIQRNHGAIEVTSTAEETKFLVKFKLKEVNNGEISPEDYQCHTA